MSVEVAVDSMTFWHPLPTFMMLLRMGDIDINQCDYDKRTALHLAAGEGHVDVVQYLCTAGANVNVQDR